MTEQQAKFAAFMQKMPAEWRQRWCMAAEFGGCGCMGCANYSGKALANGFTYDDWRQYVGGDRPSLSELRAAWQKSYDAFPEDIKKACPQATIDGNS